MVDTPVASSQAQEQTILKNKRVFKYFLRSFENLSNPELFRENAIKFAKWLENPRGYYDKARPEVRIRDPTTTLSSELDPATDHEARNGMSAVVQARHRSLSNLNRQYKLLYAKTSGFQRAWLFHSHWRLTCTTR